MTPREVDCPTCGAAPPDRCLLLGGWTASRRGVFTNGAHTARRRLAEDPDQAAIVARETRGDDDRPS